MIPSVPTLMTTAPASPRDGSPDNTDDADVLPFASVLNADDREETLTSDFAFEDKTAQPDINVDVPTEKPVIDIEAVDLVRPDLTTDSLIASGRAVAGDNPIGAQSEVRQTNATAANTPVLRPFGITPPAKPTVASEQAIPTTQIVSDTLPDGQKQITAPALNPTGKVEAVRNEATAAALDSQKLATATKAQVLDAGAGTSDVSKPINPNSQSALATAIPGEPKNPRQVAFPDKSRAAPATAMAEISPATPKVPQPISPQPDVMKLTVQGGTLQQDQKLRPIANSPDTLWGPRSPAEATYRVTGIGVSETPMAIVTTAGPNQTAMQLPHEIRSNSGTEITELGFRSEIGSTPVDRTASVAPTHAPAADQARQIAQQLVAGMPPKAPGTTEILLQPEELGRVRMSLTLQDGVMAVAIQAERPETLDLIRRHIDQLMQTYRNMGFENTSFSFSGSTQQSEGDPTGNVSFGDGPDDPEITLQPTASSLSTTGRLDLRI